MDLWLEIKLGNKWIDDNRNIHEKILIKQDVMLTSTNKITNKITKELKHEFLNAASEGFDKVINTLKYMKT